MSQKQLFIAWVTVLFVIFLHHPLNASQRIEGYKNKAPAKVIAKLKDGDFIRVRTAAKREARGYFRTFDGSRLVIEDEGNLVTFEVDDIMVVKRGRGFWGSLRKGFSQTAIIIATPVTDFWVSYQMMKWFNEAP